MKVNYNYQNFSKSPAFSGKLVLTGEEVSTESIKNVFYGNKTLQKLADESEYDIIGTIKARRAAKYEIYKKGCDEVLYKFSMTARKQTKGFFARISEFFSKRPIIKPTRNYHSEETTINVINGFSDINALKKELNIKS